MIKRPNIIKVNHVFCGTDGDNKQISSLLFI